MAASQMAEGGQNQSLVFSGVAETGQPHPVSSVAEHANRVQVAADVKSPLVGPWFVTQPPWTELLGCFLREPLDPAPSFMIATDQLQSTAQEIGQCVQLGAEFLGKPKTAVDQITQDHHVQRFESVRQGH